jgi:hypothetical protein
MKPPRCTSKIDRDNTGGRGGRYGLHQYQEGEGKKVVIRNGLICLIVCVRVCTCAYRALLVWCFVWVAHVPLFS